MDIVHEKWIPNFIKKLLGVYIFMNNTVFFLISTIFI